MRIPPRPGPSVVSWTATIARRPLAVSRQKTTCSWPARSLAANTAAGSDLDEDVVPLDLHGKAVDPAGRIVEAFAGGHIVCPRVQRASHDLTVELPFAERAAAVLAGVVDGEERAADVEQRDLTTAHLDRLALTGSEILRFADL